MKCVNSNVKYNVNVLYFRKRNELKKLYLLLIMSIMFVNLNASMTDFLKTNKYKKTKRNKGYLYEPLQAQILVGGSSLSLDIDSKIVDHIEGQKDVKLGNGGSFTFNTINTSYKQLRIQILSKFTISYKIEGTSLSLLSAPWQIPDVQIPGNPKDVFFLAKRFLGGYGELEKTNLLLGHESVFSLIYREAEFAGYYQREDYLESLTFNKDQYGVKYIMDGNVPDIMGLMRVVGTPDYTYFKFFYENSVFPQVIFIEGANYDELDEKFTSSKYTVSQGADWVLDSKNIFLNGFVYGYEVGLGMASISPSLQALQKLKEAGFTNISTTPFIIYGGIKLGYHKHLVFKNTALDVEILYNGQYLSEQSSPIENSSNPSQAYFTYDRDEITHDFKYALTWSF